MTFLGLVLVIRKFFSVLTFGLFVTCARCAGEAVLTGRQNCPTKGDTEQACEKVNQGPESKFTSVSCQCHYPGAVLVLTCSRADPLQCLLRKEKSLSIKSLT